MKDKQDDKFICKITGFVRFINDPKGEDAQHCTAIKENGDDILIDPFVGCVYNYENREHLLSNWYEVEGHWFVNEKYEPDPIFLVNEGKMRLIELKQ